MNTKLFSLDGKDILKGVYMAVLSGAILPIILIIQAPDFNFAQANWDSIFSIAINGAISGFAGYIMKNFMSDENGKLFGKY